MLSIKKIFFLSFFFLIILSSVLFYFIKQNSVKTGVEHTNSTEYNNDAKYPHEGISYEELREKCVDDKYVRYGCFYFLAIIESSDILVTNKNSQCPTGYNLLSGNDIPRNIPKGNFNDLSYCKINKKNEKKPISKIELELKIKDNSNECIARKLVNVDKDSDSILVDFKLKDFQEDYTLMKISDDVRCKDVLVQATASLVFYSKTEDMYYLAEENKLEYFLKGEKKFLTERFFIDTGRFDYSLFMNEEPSLGTTSLILSSTKREKMRILQRVMENNYNLDLKIADTIGFHKKKKTYQGTFFDNQIGDNYDSKLNKNRIRYIYKMKNPYRGNLFFGIEKEEKDKSTCYPGKLNIKKEDIKIFLMEISDNFKILNKKEIYSENDVKTKRNCFPY